VLARVVENMYWLARYLERVENTARLVSVNTNLLLDLPSGFAPGWLPLIDITGGRQLFDQLHPRADEREVVQFLIASRDNPGSIHSSLRAARENARTLREALPSEAWELLNQSYHEFTNDLPNGLNKRTRFDFLKRVVQCVQTLMGGLEGTMNRNDAYTFLLIGRNLERADMTSRIVDVRSAQLLPAETPELRPFDTIQWMSVLKSLSAYQMYRLRLRTRVRRTDVLEFLLRDQQFPRSCLFCLEQVELCLRQLPRSEGVLDAVAGVRSFLRSAELARLDQPGVHELIDRLQLHIIGLHDATAAIYFPARAGSRPAAAFSRAQEQRQTLSLFADAVNK
jgi:uncharacterized alpha-E superfamily protein